MKNLRKRQLIAIGSSIAVLYGVLCLVAFASAASRTEKPAPVDAEQYANFMGNEVLDIQDLAEGAEVQRRMFNRITPPGLSWTQPMFPPVAPFDAPYFDDPFLEGLLGEDKNSVAIYPLSLIQDPKTRETLIYNAEGELIAAIPADRGSREWPADADPSRVILQLDLLPAEDVEPYLYTERRIEESLARYNAPRSAKSGGAATRGLEAGEFGICDIQGTTNGTMFITVTNGANVAEVFAYTVWHTSSVVVVTWTNEQSNVVTDTNTVWHQVSPAFNGLESAWECLTTTLVLTNGVGVYENANISSNARIRFYAVANRQDSDGDGLTDGMEIFVHHTDPGNPDTDGDGWSDAEELAAGTNPLDRLDAPHLARNVLIHAICYNPANGFASSNQWVQLHSSCRYPVDLTGFRIQVAGSNYVTRFTFTNETWIRPGHFILIGGENVPERDYLADLWLPQSYSSLPTAGVRLMPPAGGMRSENGPPPSDVLMYGTHSPFNEQGLPTNGWESVSTTLWANTGYMLTRLALGLDTDSRTNWTFQLVGEIYNSETILDSDKDGLDDGTEYSGDDNRRPPTDPLNPDSDGDGLEDDFEIIHGLDPNRADSDGNSTDDGNEINPDTGNTYLEDQLADGLTVLTVASNPDWTMGQSIGSNGYVQFTIHDIGGIGIWATIREGGAAPEAFTSMVTNAVIVYSNNSYVAGFRTLSLLLVQNDTNVPVVVTIGDGGTYWTNQTPQNIGPDISARFQAVQVRMDNGESFYYPNSEYAYAYITGAPEMPAFFVYLTPENKLGGNVSWRCKIAYSRDNRADVEFYPSNSWKNLPARSTWDLHEDMGSDIRGGTASFYCQLGGKISTHVMYIRGLNPQANAVEAMFVEEPWYALPIAKRECGYSSGTYFHFNETGVLGPNPEDYRNCPSWGSPQGWGLMQMDNPVPSAQQLWSWSANVSGGLAHLNGTCRIEAVAWIAEQESQQQDDDPSQPLANEVFTFNGIDFQKGTARTPEDACTIQRYNGAQGWVIYWRRPTQSEPGCWILNSAQRGYVDAVCGWVE